MDNGNVSPELCVSIRMMSGDFLSDVRVLQSSSVRDLKVEVASRWPDKLVAQQRLFFDEVELNDDQILAQLCIPQEAVLDLLLRPGLIDESVAALSDPCSSKRITALNAIMKTGMVALPYASEVLPLFVDDVPGVRCAAAEVLGNLGSHGADLAATRLNDCDWRARWAAARTLEHAAKQSGGEAAAAHVPELGLRLSDDWPAIRVVAARALGCCGEHASSQYSELRRAMLNGDSHLREAAITALGHISYQRAACVAASVFNAFRR
eukprot:TRINITY_DN10645_c0_g1_i2.p1 TRINITY_DN10645_c0_g1~~TRINITY_DN10645_c0_g1_i2.p1  ORF type:complete len:265 (+),score=43.56 TRINITY_DN10645_c0_g1_i2:198-992(+)